MGSVTKILLVRPAKLRSIRGEIVPIDIIDISIPVIIPAFHAIQLSFIYPHIGLKVRMGVHDSLINNGNDYGWVSRRESPCILYTDIRAFHSRLADTCIAGIDQMPLLR